MTRIKEGKTYYRLKNTLPYKWSDEELDIMISFNQYRIDKLTHELNYIKSSSGNISQTKEKLDRKKRERTKFKRDLNRRKKRALRMRP